MGTSRQHNRSPHTSNDNSVNLFGRRVDSNRHTFLHIVRLSMLGDSDAGDLPFLNMSPRRSFVVAHGRILGKSLWWFSPISRVRPY